MKVLRGLWIVTGLLLLLCGCAGLKPSYETPGVQLSSIQLLPSAGLQQRLRLGLRITNPNRVSLNAEGLSYTLRLQGHEVMTGVTAELPTIPAYGEGDVTVDATVSLLNSWQFLQQVMAKPDEPIRYELDAKLDTGWWVTPISITESGDIKLGQ